MSNSKSTLRRLADIFLPTGSSSNTRSSNSLSKDYKLEQLIAFGRKGVTENSERIEPSDILMRRAELLYRLDPLIFSSVNKITRRITGTKTYFMGGTTFDNETAMEFYKDSNLERLLPCLVKDAFLYGFGVAEIVRKDNKVSLSLIDPKEFDYQRDGTSILRNKNGEIVGFEWQKSGMQDPVKLAPEQVFILRYFYLGDLSIGISPVEAAFKSSWIKLNVIESLGETIYRHGFPTMKYTVGSADAGPWKEVTPEKIKSAQRILQELRDSNELILPWWMDGELMTPGSIGDVFNFINMLSLEILSAFEMPKVFSSTTQGSTNAEELDFEKSIIAFQEETKKQIHEQLLYPYYKEKKLESTPNLTFVEFAPEMQNLKLRRLSSFSKYGLITRNDELENTLRTAEGFPLKKRKQEFNENCIFNLGTCPIRQEEDMPMDKLVAFCNICIKRLEAERDTHKVETQPANTVDIQEEESVPIINKETLKKNGGSKRVKRKKI